ncbi:glycosyl hydrolase family 18 protein [Alkaliphilus peptidifermentans]|uniref:Glycosyl hydrolases family 18 n=1 Tax=Alkaliphilus peptidifermentans DSM 18978 TaxID=1120976 RepID=A0A1G5LD64_9FIRM|nr:glycosyl hydrolase family 18 protein [Alkaliphilus peptidifermentans]SCZ10736.1 Glycosyl hydrolases family 18 [Alkaliphilus peptidifermentans DSM 18978]
MKKGILFLICLVVLIIVGAFGFSLMVEGSHFQYQEGTDTLIVDNELIQGRTIIDGSDVFVAIDIVDRFIYPFVDVITEEKRFFIPSKLTEFYFENSELDEFVKQKDFIMNFNLKEEEGNYYLPLAFLQNLIGIEVNYIEESGLVIIDSINSNGFIGQAIEKINVLQQPRLVSGKVTSINTGETVNIFSQSGNYYFVRTLEGKFGYVRKDKLEVENEDLRGQAEKAFKSREEWQPEGKIGLVWDYVHQFSKDRRGEEKLDAIDVVSPTWFKMTDSDGTLMNKGDKNYVVDAHEKGYRVWGLVTNSFDPDMTSEFLASQEAQEHFIRQILFYSGLYQLDGINIDFENIHYKDKDTFTSFVERLTNKLKKDNLVVSIDVTIPSTSPNWSMVYDRVKLGEIVDYVAVMTYDEHWAASPKSGSVASIGWVERGIQKTLELVPNEKVLLGLPFYTRLWEEEKIPGNRVKVSSRAYGMDKIKEILVENDAEIDWDEITGQYYSEYENDGKTYKVWLENERSLALKTTLVEKYDLAGIAAWRKDFEHEGVWPVLANMIKFGKTYNQILVELNK